MDKEEIIEIIEKLQCEYKEQENEKKYNDYTVFKAKEYSKGLQGLLDLYNKETKKNDILQTNYEILQGEMDRIGIDTLGLEPGNSTDDVIEEIKSLLKEKEKNKELERQILSKSGTYEIGIDFGNAYISKDKVKKVLINSANEDKYDFHSAYEKLFEDFEKILEED